MHVFSGYRTTAGVSFHSLLFSALDEKIKRTVTRLELEKLQGQIEL